MSGMRRVGVVTIVGGAIAFSAATALAGGPPPINETTHVVDEAFGPELGFDCATGSAALISGVEAGIVKTLVRADGSVLVSGSLRGTASADDLPADGTADVVSEFVETFSGLVFSSGGEVQPVTLTATSTILATGQQVRVHFVAQLVLDPNGVPRLDFERLTRCD